MGGPLLLVAGGSGIVPLMSMLRHRRNVALDIQALLLYSSRARRDVIFRDELERDHKADPRISVLHTLTREQPDGWQGFARRVDRPMLEDVLGGLDGAPWSYICGPTPFVELVAGALVNLGVPPHRVRTERFGPSGGSSG
jgi:ferredoxin-NADP reductase